jgi:hypothetical protein
MTSSRDAWERVLATVEAEARRAEALLQAPAEEFVPRQEAETAAVDSRPTGLPAEWLLPMTDELPPLESMPPVPPELSDRILALRSQITQLQTELASAMRDIARHQPRTLVNAVPVEVPAFIDRRL